MPRKILLVSMFAVAGMMGGCSSDDLDTEGTRSTIEEAASEAQKAANDALASLRTDAERFVDDVQTRNAPEAKNRLLDRCRDALEQLRKNNSGNADRMAGLCDRIQNTDVTDNTAWNEIKDEIEKIR